MISKQKIRNPKHEIRNKFKTENHNDQNNIAQVYRIIVFGILVLGHLNLFRILGFEIRICDGPPTPKGTKFYAS